MSLTWRDVQPASAQAANSLVQSGQESFLTGLKAVKDMLTENEQRNIGDKLGKLQLATASVGSSDPIKDILYAASQGNLDGKAMANIASSAVAQGKNLFDQGLEQEKFNTTQSNFLKKFGLEQEDLNLRTERDNRKLRLDEQELAQRDSQFNANLSLDREKFNSDKAYRDAQIANQRKEINEKIAAGQYDRNMQDQLFKLTSSDTFKGMDAESQFEALAPFAGSAKDAANILDSNNSKSKNTDGKTNDYADLAKTLLSEDSQLAPEDKVKLQGIISEAKARGVPANVIGSYIAENTDLGGFWEGNWIGSANVGGKVKSIDWDNVNEYARDSGLGINATTGVEPNVRKQTREILGR